MSKKNKREEPIQINAPFAYVQAIDSLNVSRKLALEHKDYNCLVAIANSWIEIGNHMLTAEVELVYDDGEAYVTSDDKPLTGFGFIGGTDGREEEIEPTPSPDEG